MVKRVNLSVSKDTQVPDHIAIIPDGNRRWARARGLPTLQGHKKGSENAVSLGRAARDLGVHTVTLWGFSTENWDRTRQEVGYLMKLYAKLLDDYLEEAKENKVRLIHLGRKDRLPGSLLKKIARVEQQTAEFDKYIMNVAIDYGGHDEIIRAVKKMIEDKVTPEMVSEDLFEKYLDTKNQPYPYVDLMIRTSGEQRTSGFLLWQSHYNEFYWERDHFPDFGPEKLKEAVLDYSRRRRRFGGNDAVEHLNFKPELAANLELNWWRLANIPKGTRFRDYAMEHVREQFGLSRKLAKEAGRYLLEAAFEGKSAKWGKSKAAVKKFYRLIKDEVKLAFEPEIVASLHVKLLKETQGREEIYQAGRAEDTARELYAEVYRLSLFQAAKAAHLRVMASIERNLAEKGFGEDHWQRAEDYLEKFYRALKERVA